MDEKNNEAENLSIEIKSENIALEIIDEDSIIIDRNPVELAFCHKNETNKDTKETQFDAEERKRKTLAQVFDEMVKNCQGNKSNSQIRRPESVKSFGCDTESEFEFSDVEEDEVEEFSRLRENAENSDDEFDRLVKYSSHLINKIHASEYRELNAGSSKTKHCSSHKTKNIREYDDLPPIENLSIHCASALVEFGKVVKLIDCILIVEPSCNEVLDFDSYLFDSNAKAIGQIYDIFGQVKNPSYAIRFNSKDEAAVFPIDMKVFYAPNEKELCKIPFKGLNMVKASRDEIQKINKKIDHEEALKRKTNQEIIEGIDSDVEFSDDEAEKEFKKNLKSSNQKNPRRKRDREGCQKVHFNESSQEYQQPRKWDWHNSYTPKPYRRDFHAPQLNENQTKSSTVESSKPTHESSSDNPYAEFGCYGGFSERFGF